MLHYKIKQIIVELPEFGIQEATNEIGLVNKDRNKIYAKFTNSGKSEIIEIYRKEFNQQLDYKNLKDSIIQIDFDSVCRDYNKCLEL